MILPRPQPGEVPSPVHARYIDRVVGEVAPGAALQQQRDELLADLHAVSESGSALRYAEGKWSIKQVVGHLSDAERIFAYRLLRIARADQTPLPGFDENAYVDAAAFDEQPLEHLVDEWSSVRAASLTLVRGLAPPAWNRIGTASSNTISARALLYLILGHTEHHRVVLAERYRVGRR